MSRSGKRLRTGEEEGEGDEEDGDFDPMAFYRWISRYQKWNNLIIEQFLTGLGKSLILSAHQAATAGDAAAGRQACGEDQRGDCAGPGGNPINLSLFECKYKCDASGGRRQGGDNARTKSQAKRSHCGQTCHELSGIATLSWELDTLILLTFRTQRWRGGSSGVTQEHRQKSRCLSEREQKLRMMMLARMLSSRLL